MKSIFVAFSILLLCFILSCGSNPQDDWIGTWYEEKSGAEVTYQRNGMMVLAVESTFYDERFEINMGTYSVSDDSYTLTFFDNLELEELGFAGVIVTGTWTIKNGVLTQYPDNNRRVLRLRRV